MAALSSSSSSSMLIGSSSRSGCPTISEDDARCFHDIITFGRSDELMRFKFETTIAFLSGIELELAFLKDVKSIAKGLGRQLIRYSISYEEIEPVADEIVASGNSTPDSPSRSSEEERDPSLCLRMYRAALKGDWKEADEIITANESIVRWEISLGSYTALHVAVGARQVRFVEKLVEKMTPEDLRLKDEKNNTAFCVAAATGSLEIAKILMRKAPDLPRLAGAQGRTPLYFAALFGHQEMAACLYSPELDGKNKELFFTCIKSGLYGLALLMLKKNPDLAWERDIEKQTALHLLAIKPSAFTSETPQGMSMNIKYLTSKIYMLLTKCLASRIIKMCAELADELDKNNLELNTVLDLLASVSTRMEEKKALQPTKKEKRRSSILPTKKGRQSPPDNWFSSLFSRLWKKLERYFGSRVLETHPELLLQLHGDNLKVALTDILKPEHATLASELLPKILERNEYSAHALVKNLWDEVAPDYSRFKDILTNPTHLLFDAAESGNSKFVAQLIHDSPDLIWETTAKNWTIIHAAVNNRNERIFSLIYEIGVIKDVIATYRDKENDNTLLHLAAKLAPASQLNKLPGPAFQMQRELLWFEEVKSIMRPSHIEMKNNKSPDGGITPQDLFSAEHIDLLKAGQEWMNGTARSCTLVSTLIASALFAALVSVSLSGNHPLQKASFRIFIISDAIACLFALMSTLTFLAILTSPYAERDFLIDLPGKLKTGLALLLVSIITMMVAFSSAVFIGYGRNDFQPILVTVLASLTVVVSVVQQWQLLSIVFGSASSADSIFKRGDTVLQPNKRNRILENIEHFFTPTTSVSHSSN